MGLPNVGVLGPWAPEGRHAPRDTSDTEVAVGVTQVAQEVSAEGEAGTVLGGRPLLRPAVEGPRGAGRARHRRGPKEVGYL